MGGQENCLRGFAHYLDRYSFEPIFACLSPRGWLNEEIEKIGIKTYNFDITSGYDYPKATMRLLNFVRKSRPDIIHTQLRFSSFLGALVGRITQIPLIISTRTYTEYFGKYKFLDYLSSHLSDVIVAVSESARNIVTGKERISPSKVRIITNGIDPAQLILPHPNVILEARERFNLNNCCVIGMVSNLHPIKGHKFLIEAFAKLYEIKLSQTIKLLIVGKGPLLEDLRQLACKLGVEKDVIFTGFIPELPLALSLIDIFVHPSINEGMSIVMMEAMALGKPIVTTRVGGTPELVKDEETGLLVPSQDSEALAGAISKLLKNPDLINKMGEKARQRVMDNFTIEKTVRNYENLYKELSG
jgi:glycosyltransferase involved in cell wall biosynthesis